MCILQLSAIIVLFLSNIAIIIPVISVNFILPTRSQKDDWTSGKIENPKADMLTYIAAGGVILFVLGIIMVIIAEIV